MVAVRFSGVYTNEDTDRYELWSRVVYVRPGEEPKTWEQAEGLAAGLVNAEGFSSWGVTPVLQVYVAGRALYFELKGYDNPDGNGVTESEHKGG